MEEERGLPRVDVVDLQSSLPLAKFTAYSEGFFSTISMLSALILFEIKVAASAACPYFPCNYAARLIEADKTISSNACDGL